MIYWVCPLVIKHGNPKSQILYRLYIYIYTYDIIYIYTNIYIYI